MNDQSTPAKAPKVFDFSRNSTNPYTVEERHGLIPPCLICGCRSIVTLDGAQYFAYFMRGARIEEAFPNLTLPEREVLITGTHPECWDALAPEEDDD